MSKQLISSPQLEGNGKGRAEEWVLDFMKRLICLLIQHDRMGDQPRRAMGWQQSRVPVLLGISIANGKAAFILIASQAIWLASTKNRAISHKPLQRAASNHDGIVQSTRSLPLGMQNQMQRVTPKRATCQLICLQKK